MSRREAGPHFKRILSHTSSGSGNVGSREQSEFSNTKKLAKGAAAPDTNGRSRPGNNYMLSPDHEPLLHHGPPTSPTYGDVSWRDRGQRRNQVSPNRMSSARLLETPRYDSTHGQFPPVDFRQDLPRGIMSVTDIEVTMGDELQDQMFQPPTSPVDESVTPSYPSPRQANRCCQVQRCNKISCDENSCLWHRCVLKVPQHVRWEDKTVTVELERKGNESFGFGHKAMQHKESDEIYILVSKVEPGSKSAKSGLSVGDLILSVNSIPMQTKQKLSEINFKTMSKLRLQIQHPLEISSKAAKNVEQLAASMEENKEQSIKIPDSVIRLPQPLSPSTSPCDAGFAHCLSPTKENIPLSTIPKPETKQKPLHHQLPQVRVFVCGNATNEFVRCLIGDLINVHLDVRACSFQISMRKSRDGTVSIGNSESFSYLLKDSSESCINVELVSVCDDSFFHHCCSWMFKPKSIFILTFDTKRLLSSSFEMSRLCSLAHTVRTGVPGLNTNLRVYGITSADDSIHPDEVQTLFYTPLGEHLPDPKVITINGRSFSAEMKQTRVDIFKILTNVVSSETQQVIYPTAIALDMLVSHRALTTTRDELTKTLEDWNSESHKMEPQVLNQVIEDLRNTGNLLVTGSVNAACISENDKEFVIPSMLFDYLSRLTQYSDKDRISMKQQDIWLNLCTCGIVTRAELHEVLKVCISDPEKLLSCMEDLHLVFPVKVLSQDSGFGDISSILYPYFLEDIPFDPDSADNYEKYAVLEFSEDVPSSSFFSLLSELSQSDECQSFTMKAQYVSQMRLQSQDICMYFLKTFKQIQIFRKRSGQASGPRKTSIAHLLENTVRKQVPSSVRVSLDLQSAEGKTSVRCGAMKVSNIDNCVGATSDQTTEAKRISIEDNNLPGASFDVEPDLPGGACAAFETPMNQTSIPGDLMAIPVDLIMGNVGGATAAPNANGYNQEEERAQQEVLNMCMMDLRGIFGVLQEICGLLSSMDSGWETLAGHLGANLSEVKQYESLCVANPNKLPARTFLDCYLLETRCTLLHFLEAFLEMARDKPVLYEKAQRLWTAALMKNSQYYRRHFNYDQL